MKLNTHDQTYHTLLEHILKNGKDTGDRTGTGTRAVFGYQMRFDLSKGFPLLTTKKVPFGLIVSELLWFIQGDTKLKTLLKQNNHIWDDWPFKAYLKENKLPIPTPNSPEWEKQINEFNAKILNDKKFEKKYGDLGPVYGFQWRSWPASKNKKIDQLKDVLEQLKKSPTSRRLIVSAWNPADIEEMAKAGLPPCHCLFQFKVLKDKIHLHLYQRSCDTFLGVPFNIASYSLLLLMVAQVTGYKPGEFVWTGGDVHVYKNHFKQVKEQLKRDSKNASPKIKLNREIKDLFKFKKEDIELVKYDSHSGIKAPIAV
jgi:thymidylate synthase